MLIVTMTTVGFGDFVPRTLIARSFTAIIAVIGIFLMALCISLVHESLQLTQQEKRVLAYVENTGWIITELFLSLFFLDFEKFHVFWFLVFLC